MSETPLDDDIRAILQDVLDLLAHNPLGKANIEYVQYREWRLVEFALIDRIKRLLGEEPASSAKKTP